MYRRMIIIVFTGLFSMLFPKTLLAEESESIQALLEKAKPGDTIQLENRVYQEDVVINKPVVIKGAGNTVIKGSGDGNVVTLTHDGITLENVTIKNSSSILDKDFAGIKIYSNDNKVMHIRIENSLHGIYLSENKGNKLIDNTITGDQKRNQSRRGNGIHLFHSSENVIKGNTIDSARDGIYFSFAEHNQIKQNTLTGNRYGLHYMYSDQNTFYQNEFFENVGGAAIMYSDDIVLKENRFHDHYGLQSFGVLLQTANNVKMIDNQINFNQKGIFMDQSNRNVLKDNQIINNRIGVDVWSSSVDNIFSENRIIGNNLQYSTNSGKDANNWSEAGIGNAWSDHTVVDLDQDGIADNPYQFTSAFGEVLSKQPLGTLFLDSPALGLYEKWNQLIGTDTSNIKDPYPVKVNQLAFSIFPFGLIIILLTIGALWIGHKRAIQVWGRGR
ncbi:hypothetical protein GCM10011409_31980 [Lentibacillus populi]|uniref:Carbohydrate-binding/sugar hydrolysis domain-containing protein n=1 Tax=Lentibacillus populi TaxID=1827502 RepID=A0A9W5U041_9BACI|nr:MULTISPECIES: nitrous oxide reductase family maturation protein NosD [Bacillaceae]MBT2216513.1 nitrous oxide reductase family maturation protein NosD [Virgibacillus dakarensis]GGB51979.1 hypothetical protein GCM10011409_31980 [Lentibacillus populi]